MGTSVICSLPETVEKALHPEASSLFQSNSHGPEAAGLPLPLDFRHGSYKGT